MSKLTIEGVTVKTERGVVANGISFSASSGTISMLMGPNGSGKSSLVNAICGHPHYQILSGKILLDDEDITDLSTEKKAKKGIFLSLQHIPRIGGVSLTTFLHKAHHALGGHDISILEYYAELLKIAERFSIDKALLDRPLTAGLSGGERKLSEILQLMALKPKIAILDEIDSGLDVDAMCKVFIAIDSLKKEGTGCVIISHNVSLLDHIIPDHVHVMGNGRLVRSDGADLARLILSKGFCSVLNCERVSSCEGVCASTE